MYLAVMVGKFVKQVVREWCSSTTGPLLPTMTDSLLAPGWEEIHLPARCKQYHHFCPCQEQEGPQAWDLGRHAQIFRMKRDHKKGFYSEKC